MAGRVPVSEFADKAVLIGKTDPIGGDVFVTSISSDPMPGVEVHANALWTVLAGIPLKSVPAPANIALILALIATPAIIGRRRSGLLILAGSLALLVLVLVGVQLAFNAGWIITVTYPLLGLAASAGGHDCRGCIHAAASSRGTREDLRRSPAAAEPFSVLHQLPARPERLAGKRYPAGRDERLRAGLARLAGTSPVRVVGFVDDVRTLLGAADLLVTKAGGMTIAEATAAEIPLLLYGSLPGQERGNERFASRAGIALVARSRGALRRLLDRAVGDPDTVERLQGSLRRLRRPDAAQHIVDLVVEQIAQRGRP